MNASGQTELGLAATAVAEDADARDCRAVQAGDSGAVTNLYRRYGPVIHGILLARVGYPEADDLTQEVFMRAMRGISALKSPDSLGAWLCTIARNEAARAMKKRGSNALKLAGLAHEPRPATPEASTRLESEEALASIRALPEAYQETMILRLVEGLTGPEIASRTGMTHGSVRVNLTRGMKLLRESLGESQAGSGDEREGA